MNLTRSQILAADERQLDEWCAVHVMGWKPVWLRHRNVDHFIGGHFPTRQACKAACEGIEYPALHWEASPGIARRNEFTWSPATDRNAAAEVVERIGQMGKELKFGIELLLLIKFSVSEQCIAHSVLRATPDQIVKAALLAGGGVE